MNPRSDEGISSVKANLSQSSLRVKAKLSSGGEHISHQPYKSNPLKRWRLYRQPAFGPNQNVVG